jgi:glutamyl-tRNA reductase
MSILAFGINHTTASVDLRGRVAFAPEIVIESLQQALTHLEGDEIALL